MSEAASARLPFLRHSTQSNLRYIYRSAVPFLCQCADNRFRARCSRDCPVYADRQAQLRAKAIEALNPKPYVRPPLPVPEVVLPVKAAHREQFETGLRLALEEVKKGTKLPRIVELLNQRGLKTKTGRQWLYATRRNELERLKQSEVPPPSDREGADGPACSDA